MNTFYQKQYSFWDIDLNYLKNSCTIDVELNKAFENSKIFNAPEKIGEGKSLMFNILPKFDSYNFLYNFVIEQVQAQLNTNFHIPLYYRRKKLNLKRCWANRVFKNSEGLIHFHANSLVFLLYYNIPNNSSDLVFINPKHIDKIKQSESSIPIEDKLAIKVHSGMCILHDGNILHGVSKHNNDNHRDVLVFEFDGVFY